MKFCELTVEVLSFNFVDLEIFQYINVCPSSNLGEARISSSQTMYNVKSKEDHRRTPNFVYEYSTMKISAFALSARGPSLFYI